MKTKKYAWQQVVLHWLSAVVIIWATITGFYAAMFETTPEIKEWIGFFNVSLTTVFIPFFILRVYYLLNLGKPHEGKKDFASRAADWVHMLLYINIAVVLITGVPMMDRDINVFNLFSIPHLIESELITDLFFVKHIISCTTLAGLVLLHILTVVKHELFGNRVLRRMSW